MTKLKKLIHDIDSTRSKTLNKREILLRLLEIDENNCKRKCKANNIEVEVNTASFLKSLEKTTKVK
mgnify:CR=1 FL=1